MTRITIICDVSDTNVILGLLDDGAHMGLIKEAFEVSDSSIPIPDRLVLSLSDGIISKGEGGRGTGDGPEIKVFDYDWPDGVFVDESGARCNIYTVD